MLSAKDASILASLSTPCCRSAHANRPSSQQSFATLGYCLQRHGFFRLIDVARDPRPPDVEGAKTGKGKFKPFPFGVFHIDIPAYNTGHRLKTLDVRTPDELTDKQSGDQPERTSSIRSCSCRDLNSEACDAVALSCTMAQTPVVAGCKSPFAMATAPTVRPWRAHCPNPSFLARETYDGEAGTNETLAHVFH